MYCFPLLLKLKPSIRDVEAEAMEAVKFLWKRKHFEEVESGSKLGSD